MLLYDHIRYAAKWVICGDFPSHPDTILFKSEYYTNPIREKHIWTFYDLIRPKILPVLKDFPLFIYIATDSTFIIKRHQTEDFITVSNKEEFDKINNGRTVEFHIATPTKSAKQWIDIDPGNDVEFAEVKEITLETADALKKVAKVSHYLFTGSRGFYLEMDLSTKRNTNDFRNEVSDFLKEHYVDSSSVVFKKPSKDQIRIDFTPIKDFGGHRATFSLAAVKLTGLVCVPIDKVQVRRFRKEQATIPNVVKKFTGKSCKID